MIDEHVSRRLVDAHHTLNAREIALQLLEALGRGHVEGSKRARIDETRDAETIPDLEARDSYPVDETNADWTQVDLKNFIREFAEQSGAENIFLIAHSMGARALTGALKDLLLEYPAIRPKLTGPLSVKLLKGFSGSKARAV